MSTTLTHRLAAIVREKAEPVNRNESEIAGYRDVLATPDGVRWHEGVRVLTRNTHGTGCSLSSAIAAELGKGRPLAEAVAAAKSFIAGAVRSSDALAVGSGHGPLHHFHALWA